jgi:hypothetical protein
MHSAPHFWKAALQVKPHAVPSQDAVPFAGTSHCKQLLPQKFTSFVATQVPLHSFFPAGQPPHTIALLMHALAHRTVGSAQVPPHLVPSQEAVPPVMSGHAVHEVPQFLTSVFETQASAQRW